MVSKSAIVEAILREDMVELEVNGNTGEGVERTTMRGLSLLPCMSDRCLCRDERDSNVDPAFA